MECSDIEGEVISAQEPEKIYSEQGEVTSAGPASDENEDFPGEWKFSETGTDRCHEGSRKEGEGCGKLGEVIDSTGGRASDQNTALI